jgi:L-alanine-DL-glutamate epimerase-like enolase superfamily enzyme
MKIEAITLREISMPLVHFFETSFGRTTGRRIILVTVHAEGVEGWGECVAGEHPFYSPEDVETAWHTLANYFAPSLIGKNVEGGRDAIRRFPGVRGHRMAKGALENAVWDAEAIAKKTPFANGIALRRVHRDPGLPGKVGWESSDGTGCGLPTHQAEVQTWLGPEHIRADSQGMAFDSAELRCEFRIHDERLRSSETVRSI